MKALNVSVREKKVLKWIIKVYTLRNETREEQKKPKGSRGRKYRHKSRNQRN